jgi:hypothetical protein
MQDAVPADDPRSTDDPIADPIADPRHASRLATPPAVHRTERSQYQFWFVRMPANRFLNQPEHFVVFQHYFDGTQTFRGKRLTLGACYNLAGRLANHPPQESRFFNNRTLFVRSVVNLQVQIIDESDFAYIDRAWD